VQHVEMSYVDSTAPEWPIGVTVGVPWPCGALHKGQEVSLFAHDGRAIPSQSWPIGFWPDGSVKWIAVAATPQADHGEQLCVGPANLSVQVQPPLTVKQSGETILIDNGLFTMTVNTRGQYLTGAIRKGDVEVCSGTRLLAILERRTDDHGGEVITRHPLTGVIRQATVEQSGPVRAVVKLEGTHGDGSAGELTLPFTVRLYIYANVDSVRIVHTFIYDGQGDQDFVAGIGVQAEVPMRDATYNRRVWFAQEAGAVWSEAVSGVPPMMSRQSGHFPNANPDRARHIAGEAIDSPGGAGAMPVWNQFEQVQASADHFVIRKGVKPNYALVEARHGHRAEGTVALTDCQGGLAASIRDFWQAYPSSLSIERAGSESSPALVTAWLWPPQAAAADMRHYSDLMYGPEYESHDCLNWSSGPVDPERSGPYGIARTSELLLWPMGPKTTRSSVATRAALCAQPPLLACKPEYYNRCKVFGVWSLPDRTIQPKRALEETLEQLLDHYLGEIEQSRWYGFWDYGDVMHSYDQDRHVWRYDEGGYAWDNTECATDLWPWYSFLRTGRADVYRFAEAMSRHNGEVDVYHIGPHAGLGSRHNVRHWGCACIEPRISMASGRRFHYFLTADERTGDLLNESCDAWPKEKTMVQAAPWWACFCWNWFTAWERTCDKKYRDKLLRGMEGILARKPPLIAGLIFEFDPDTGEMTFVEGQEPYAYHMSLPFGAPEIWMEMVEVMGPDAEPWGDAVADFGEVWAMNRQQRKTLLGEGIKYDNDEVAVFSARLIAYAAARYCNRDFARRTWQILQKGILHLDNGTDPNTNKQRQELMSDVMPVGHTNLAAQWSLNVIESLALVGSEISRDVDDQAHVRTEE